MFSHATLSTFVALLAAAESALGSPLSSRSSYAIKDKHHVPRQWSNVGDAPSNHILHLSIGLKQSQFSELERHLYEGRLSWPLPGSRSPILPKLHSC